MLHNLVLGVNHLSADVHLRDALKITDLNLKEATQSLLQTRGIHEAVIISTCNRTEIYCAVADIICKEEILNWWFNYCKIDLAELEKYRSHIFMLEHSHAVQHLFRVVCSLDSLVVGEGQILGQVRDSYIKSAELRSTGLYTHHLFQQAISLGKRVRTETHINEGAVSISLAAVELCKKVWGDLSKSRVGIIGTGEMGVLAALHLQNAGVQNFDFINRNTDNAQKSATRFGAKVWALDRLDEVLPQLDVIISCTAAPHPVLFAQHLELSQKNRKKNQIFVDIAAPSDIDVGAYQVRGCYVFNIDDLKQVVEDNRSKRLESVQEAEKILAEELASFADWYHSLEVIPVIRDIKESMSDLIELELNRYKLTGAERTQAEEILRSFANKVMHRPLTGLRLLGEEGLAKEGSFYAKKLFLSPFRKSS
jgi:glutamyl-tRNA reductase